MSVNEVLDFIGSTDQKTLAQIDEAVDMAKLKFNMTEPTDKNPGWDQEIVNPSNMNTPSLSDNLAQSQERFSKQAMMAPGFQVHIKVLPNE